MKPLVVIGSLNLDRTLELDELPSAGRTQTATGYREGMGGKGANQATAAARLGADTYMLGCLGADAAGDLIAEELKRAGVRTEELVRSGDAPTGTATILVTAAGENAIVVVPGANHGLGPGELEARGGLIRSAGMVLLQLETSLEVIAKAVAMAAEAGVPVMLDPAPAVPLAAEVLRGVAWFTPNESEARFYLGGEDGRGEEEVCRCFQAMGPRNILLKLGGDGAAMLTEDGRFVRVHAPKVTVVDTTGAGDTLNGAFAVELGRGEDAEAALRFAVAAASLSTTRAGASGAQPRREEVEAMLGGLFAG